MRAVWSATRLSSSKRACGTETFGVFSSYQQLTRKKAYHYEEIRLGLLAGNGRTLHQIHAALSTVYAEICNRIRPHLTRDMNVLELASGTGQLSFPLSPYVRLWEATDVSSSMIAEAKKRTGSSRLHFSVQDAAHLPYVSETFDVVIANALHILPEPDRVLREARRVLKPGGWLFAPTFVHAGGKLARLRT